MAYKNILVEHHDHVVLIRLNAPEVLNAMSRDIAAELHEAVTESLAAGARCLLLTGNGRAFCAGSNLQRQDDPPELLVKELETHYLPLMTTLREMNIPMVTAINGPAVGIGMSFAVMSDYAIAAKSAYFLQAFANVGLVPDGGATWLLPRIIGWRRSVELSMMAEKLPADTALEWGLINRVVEDEALMDEALKVAQKLANGPMSLGLIRKLYRETDTNSYTEQFKLEAAMQVEAHASKDCAEGMRAFMEKRAAKFKGK